MSATRKLKAQESKVLQDRLEESLTDSIKVEARDNQVDLLGGEIEQVVDYLNSIEEDFPAVKQSNEDSTSKQGTKSTQQMNQKQGQQPTMGECPYCSTEHASKMGDFSDCYHFKNN